LHDTRLSKCFLSAFGTDMSDAKTLAAYAAAKIRSGGLGALVLANEIARADACGVVTELRYYHDAGKCGEPNCGNSTKYPPHTAGACQNCMAGYHCCVPRLQRRQATPQRPGERGLLVFYILHHHRLHRHQRHAMLSAPRSL
jgi:hypothetical protein